MKTMVFRSGCLTASLWLSGIACAQIQLSGGPFVNVAVEATYFTGTFPNQVFHSYNDTSNLFGSASVAPGVPQANGTGNDGFTLTSSWTYVATQQDVENHAQVTLTALAQESFTGTPAEYVTYTNGVPSFQAGFTPTSVYLDAQTSGPAGVGYSYLAQAYYLDTAYGARVTDAGTGDVYGSSPMTISGSSLYQPTDFFGSDLDLIFAWTFVPTAAGQEFAMSLPLGVDIRNTPPPTPAPAAALSFLVLTKGWRRVRLTRKP